MIHNALASLELGLGWRDTDKKKNVFNESHVFVHILKELQQSNIHKLFSRSDWQ